MKEFELTKAMHPSRAEIIRVLLEHPNATFSHLSHALGGASTAVVRHHLEMLISKGLLLKLNKQGERNNYKVLGFSNPPTEPYYKNC